MNTTSPPLSLAGLLSAATRRDANGVAIVHSSDSRSPLTYAACDHHAGKLATALAECGVERGQRVGVLCRKSVDGFLAMHAVVRMGAVAVPLDPGAGADYLADVMTRTGVDVVITHDACRATIETVAAELSTLRAVVGLTEPLAATSSPAGLTTVTAPAVEMMAPAAPATVDPHEPAYILTTSGSTGTPKGICHTHASAVAFAERVQQVLSLRSDDRMGDIAPYHFDISTPALWVTPLAGATNVVIDEPHQMMPASLTQLLEDTGVTVWYSVPFSLRQMLSRGVLAERDLSKLRWALFGGEIMPPQELAELMEAVPSARFVNVYGPAETNWCSHEIFETAPTGDVLSVGRPWSATTIRLVDPEVSAAAGHRQLGAEDLVEVPQGVQGELFIKSPTLMQGYWEQPELTAASIVGSGTERWYRSGDIGIRTPDGDLVFVGRRDHQVKVRGRRIELEFIESVLEETPGIDLVVAAVDRSDVGHDTLVVGVISSLDADEVRELVKNNGAARLPSYARPSRTLMLTAAPTTGSGKLDRRTLRAQVLDLANDDG